MIIISLLLILWVFLGIKSVGINEKNKCYTKYHSLDLLSWLFLALAVGEVELRLLENGWDTPAYYGSVTFTEITGKSNQSILAESPRDLWLDVTTWTTPAQRKEAQRKAEAEARAKAYAKVVAEGKKKEEADFRSFVASIPQDMIAGLGEYKSFVMAAANGKGYVRVPVYENEREYIVINRDLQKKTISKSEYPASEDYNAILPTKEGYIPCAVTYYDYDDIATYCYLKKGNVCDVILRYSRDFRENSIVKEMNSYILASI